ncbi:MAG: AMP-binding protein, partial [bacterium]|nr:AMP-binding protein [bacterium]
TEQLAGRLPVLELPSDFPRPAHIDFIGKTFTCKIDAGITSMVKQAARKNGATLNMFLLTVFNLLLHTLTGNEDLLVGIPADIREQKGYDFENSVGMFTNTIVIRSFPKGEVSFKDFLAQVKTTCIEAYSNREYPFEELADKVDYPKDMSRNPIIDVVFVYENGNQRMFKLPGISFSPVPLSPGASAFDIVYETIEEEGELHVGINFRTAIFKEETIVRLQRYYVRLLEITANKPEHLLSNIEIMTEAEKKELLLDFNDTAVDFPNNSTIHQLFRSQVITYPDQIALVEMGIVPGEYETGHKHMSYMELDKQSDCLAAILVQKGIRTETIVPMVMERSVAALIGMLGILKAGGAYMPIDPDYPLVRRTYMLQDSGASLLLASNLCDLSQGTQSTGNADFPCYMEVLDMDVLLPFSKEAQKEASDAGPEKESNTGSLSAYIIYTSGSTGRSKGVMVEHKNVTRLVKNINYAELSPETRILQTGAPVFDAVTFEIWG